MEKSKIIEILEDLYRQLNMDSKEYADYANERYNHDDSYKLDPSMAYAFRTGVVKTQIECILKAEGRLKNDGSAEESEN